MKMVAERFSRILILILSVMLIFVNGCTGAVNNQGQSGTALNKIQPAIQSKLDNLDSDITGVALKLGSPGMSVQESRQILSGFCNKYPFLNDCLVADVSGKVTAAGRQEIKESAGKQQEVP